MATQAVTQSSYDQVPYPSLPIRSTHPDHIASIAAMFGMAPASPDACRVLEIGCADGANLIPMAASLPNSQFIGVDLSAAQVALGQRVIDQLSLKNVTLRQLNVMDFGAEYGVFDYIIVYGVYSWAPHEVQDKILDICSQQLAPNGVAFISYNTYPGWHMRGAVRNMLWYHTRQFEDVQTRITQARALLHFLAEAAPKIGKDADQQAYSIALDSEEKRIAKQSDSYMLHEHLEEYNEPLYFYQFAERIEKHDLQYVAEVEISSMTPDVLPKDVAQTIGRLGSSVVATEQYLDFVRNRMFRQSLLCHKGIALERTWGIDLLHKMHIASPLKPLSEKPSILSPLNERFRGPTGTVVSSSNPLNKAAIIYLSKIWPNAVKFDQLLREARDRSQSVASVEADAQMLGDTLLKSLVVDLIELHLYQPRFVIEISERPLASVIARWQATYEERVTNQRHEAIEVDGLMRAVLNYLDGQHDRAEIVRLLADILTQELEPENKDGKTLEQVLEAELHDIARAALLVA